MTFISASTLISFHQENSFPPTQFWFPSNLFQNKNKATQFSFTKIKTKQFLTQKHQISPRNMKNKGFNSKIALNRNHDSVLNFSQSCQGFIRNCSKSCYFIPAVPSYKCTRIVLGFKIALNHQNLYKQMVLTYLIQSGIVSWSYFKCGSFC